MSALDSPVLVLNRHWNPVTFLPVKTVIVTVMRDMACVLDVKDYLLMSFDEWTERHHKDAVLPAEARWIRTPTMLIEAPEVIVLKRYGERPPRRVQFNRPNLSHRDDYECQFCGADLQRRRVTVDHVLPRSRGGETSWENCVAACEECNARKADRTPAEARMPLKKKPVRPDWTPRLRVPNNGTRRAAWEPFLAKEAVA